MISYIYFHIWISFLKLLFSIWSILVYPNTTTLYRSTISIDGDSPGQTLCHRYLTFLPGKMVGLVTCSTWGDGTEFDSKWVSCLLEVKKGVIVAPGAVKIPATTQHFAVCQVHPNVLLEITNITPPATVMEKRKFHSWRSWRFLIRKVNWKFIIGDTAAFIN